ncbi:peptidoglycan DD-metalloendopeptidase family protein, partial [Kitasatospora sp. NPDC004799]|uniref:peptidoglycan DD-metalloendopeptidase family protein n=1 Tax=Kitasatospora sp. NPDC004799 TaxID=3154460 RepID=UPI0033AC2F15
AAERAQALGRPPAALERGRGDDADHRALDAVKALALATAARTTAPSPADVQVDVTRRHGEDWAFGTSVVTAPAVADAYPDGWLFLARRTAEGWRIAFDGEPDFAELAATAAVLSDRERGLLGRGAERPYAGSDFRTGMRLPYATGQAWAMTGGPHGWSGTAAPWSSVDLSGGDGRVLAARAGLAYTMCGNGKGWIRVLHDRGYATDYYHLSGNIAANGLSVDEGGYLGNTGTDTSCGGSATGAHVHFALRQNDAYVPLHGHNLGGWVVQAAGAAYEGSALHGSTRAQVDGTLVNYGALGLTSGIVDAFDDPSVNRRSGPGTDYPVVGTVADGTTIDISCSANGTSHTGRWGTTSLWNRLPDGTWISDAFVWTGSAAPVNGTC